MGVVGWLVRKLVQSIGLSGVDRLFGLLLGVVRGAFVACALVLLLGLTAVPRTPEWRASPVVPVLVPGAQWMSGWLPDWAAQRVDFRGDAKAPALVSPAGVAALPLPVDLTPAMEVAAGDMLLDRMQSMQRAGTQDRSLPRSVPESTEVPQDLPPSQQHPSTPGS